MYTKTTANPTSAGPVIAERRKALANWHDGRLYIIHNILYYTNYDHSLYPTTCKFRESYRQYTGYSASDSWDFAVQRIPPRRLYSCHHEKK